MSEEWRPTELESLPRDWRVAALREVVDRHVVPVAPTPGETYREIGIRSHGKGIFHKEPVKGAALGAKRVFEVAPHQLVFNIVFAWEGAVAVTSEDERGMIASHRFPMFTGKQGTIDVEFLRRFFQTDVGVRLLGDASPGGAGRNRTLNQKFAGEIPVPVPPLPEQRKIAAILSSVEEAIAATQAVIDQLGVVTRAMVAELLTRGLPGRHTRFKQTEIGKVPEAWQVVALVDAVDLPSGQVDPREAPYKDWPLVAPNHIERQTGRLIGLESAGAQKAISGKYVFQSGDVIYSKIRPYLRKAWLADRAGLCSADMYPLRPRGEVDGEFLLLSLLGEAFSTYAESVSMRTGIPKVNREELAAFNMPLPPLPEQREIGEANKMLAARINAEHAMLKALTTTKVALMSVLLTGEVRVKPEGEA